MDVTKKKSKKSEKVAPAALLNSTNEPAPVLQEKSNNSDLVVDIKKLDENVISENKLYTKYAVFNGLISLDEYMKQEVLNMPSKTPVSVLQEILSRFGHTPKYELVQIEGAVHEPIFKYRVTVGRTAAVGSGRSKKDAKHAAAKNVLDKILINDLQENDYEHQAPVDENVHGQEDESFSIANPIGALQELCMTKRWPPPIYSTQEESGLPHERTFTIACKIFKHVETGSGKSKKLAKRIAAAKMTTFLKNQPEKPNYNCGDIEDEEHRHGSILQDLNDLRNFKITTMNQSFNQKVTNFHKKLQNSKDTKITELKELKLLADENINVIQFLQELATEQNFETTYVDIDEKTYTGKFQCLVQLSTMPVSVCHGCGKTSKEAQTMAAYHALEYLRVILKKL